MGLESIFKPAATQSKTQRKRSRGPRVFRDDDFPSSPPSYTVTKQSHGRDVGSEMKFPGQGPLGPLEEQEEDHGNGHQADCKGMHYSVSERGKTVGDTKHGSSQNITAPTNFCQARAPADNRQGENHLNAINQRAENKDTPANLNGPQAYIPRNRTVSEEERVRNETISPIFLSTHKTVDGCIPHNAIDLSQQDLHQRIARLGLQNSLGPSTPSSDHEVPYGRVHGQDNLASPEHGLHDWTSLSLPDDLSISTDVFASKSGFVNARRRGYPNDISMQRRRLSFSSLLDIDQAESLAKRPIPNHQDRSAKSPSLFPAGFLATIHSAPPSAPLTAALLKTPTTSPHRDGASPVRLASSGSPLKLFGDYDTFTNERLLRRMSQFQAGSSEDSHEEMAHEVQGLSREHSKAEGTRTDTRGDVDDSALGTVLPKQAKRVSSFGEGQYHGYEFKEDISMVSSQSISSCDGSSNHPTLFRVEHLAGSPEIQGPGQVRQRRSDRASTKTSSTITRKWVSEVGSAQRQNTNQTMVRRQETIEEHHEVEGHAKGKRPPNSPAKDPAPKRRRTYDNVVNDFYAEEAHVAEQRPQQTQHIIGRKRKNARYDANNLEADPKVIALRQMLRPRTPSQTQNRSQRRDTVSLEDMVHGTPEPQDRTPSDGQLTNLDQEPESVETQTKAVAAELATFAIHAATSVTLDSRKPSITTQDFINEATKVMNIIRAKGKPPSGLSSIEQSDLEELEGNNQEHDEQSTKDEFSRPPSREGASIRMLRAPKQLDPRVLSHLRKFEEKDDVDIVMSSSLKTLDIQQQEHNKPNMSSVKSLIVTETGVESQPSNIRIFDDAHRERKRKHLSSPTVENPTGQSLHDVQSHMSQPSTGPSTERSIPTGSSRSSANKALIEPDKVSHLIPAQAAGMTYDHVQRTWIKRKESGRENTIDPSRPKSETTDEDPFEDIPDLSVDELEELKRVQLLKIQFKDGLGTPIEPDQRACEDPEFTEEKPATERLLESRPCTRDGTQEVPFDTSTIPSKYSHLVSSQPRTETRATSWGDEYVTTKVHPDKQEDSAETPPPPSGNREEEVEHEISILEGRLSKTPTRPEHLKHKARVVTVAFSSPLVSHVQKDEYEESPDRDTRSWTESCASPFENSGLGQYSGMRRNQRSASKRSSASSVQRSTHYGAPRQVSFAGQTFTARPISRIDELSEVSFGHSHVDVLRQSLDMAVSTPRPVPSTAGQRSNFSFHLSPLPEFSVHQLDESLQLDINHVAQRNGHISVQEVEGCFSLAVSELVKRIADVEPFEPYWEYIRKLNLQSAGMITLHQLREFCGRIEELDVADNELGQLNGAPSTIRHLKIQRNCLSNLTAWGHMSNLQYLDVSGNQIESLDGFSSLVHLRELRADDNKITNIEGIFDLDGLIALKLRRNCLGSVDFKGAEL